MDPKSAFGVSRPKSPVYPILKAKTRGSLIEDSLLFTEVSQPILL